jgi:hypothetical protein
MFSSKVSNNYWLDQLKNLTILQSVKKIEKSIKQRQQLQTYNYK